MESIGSRLEQARKQKGVDIEQAERDTHIAKRFISAMEAEAFDEFPGEAYLLGFLRSYSSYLDLDPEATVNLFHNLRLQEQPAPIDELLDTKAASGRLWRLVPYVVGVVALVAVVVLFATGTVSLPERRERADRIGADQPDERSVFELSDQFVERRFAAGDRVAVPVDGERALLEFVSIGETVAVGSEAGIVQLSGTEERLIDLTGEGSGDLRIAVRQVYLDEEPAQAVVRLDRVLGGAAPRETEQTSPVSAQDVEALQTGMTNVPARARDAVRIAEFAAAEAYFIEAEFRGDTLFRWEIDEQPREERFLQSGDRVRSSVEDIARIWASNAGNVRLRVAGNPVELGGQGQVVAAVVRWRATEGGAFSLELLPLY